MEIIRPYSAPHEELARTIKRGRVGVHIVDFPSIKNSRVIVCESKLEADFCQLLEFDPEVVSYVPQPITVSISVNNESHEYTPDFQAAYRFKPDGFFEIKPEGVITWDKYQALMVAVSQHFSDIGNAFEVVLSSTIRQEPFLGNLKYLYSKLHIVAETEFQYLIDCMTRFGGEVGYIGLLEMSNPPTIGSIAKAIYTQVVDVDLSKEFGRETVLRMRGQR